MDESATETEAEPTTQLIPNPVTELAENDSKLDLFAQFCNTKAEDYNVVLAVAQIPSLFGVSQMATYLGYRALGLTTQQALLMMHEDEDALDYWALTNPQFKKFELEALPLIQKYAAKELIRLGFMRNQTLLMAQDQRIINKALERGINQLSKNEFDWLKTIRKHYTNADFLAIEKVINPEDHREVVQEVHVSWGNESFKQAELIDGEAV